MKSIAFPIVILFFALVITGSFKAFFIAAVCLLFIAAVYSAYLNYGERALRWVKLRYWMSELRAVAFIKLLAKNFDWTRRLIYVSGAILVALVVNKFSGAGYTPEVLSNYLVATGAMTGGTIAIVFTISLFLLQNAADLYSSQYLEIYIHDWKEKLVYFLVILITLFLLGGGLYIGGVTLDGGSKFVTEGMASWIVILSLVMIGLVFALIDWQYTTVSRKIKPTEAIQFLEKEAKKFIKRLKKGAEKSATILQLLHGSISRRDAVTFSYRKLLESNDLNRQLENLVEISTKLSDKGEIQTTKRCYTAVFNILSEFFELRKDSSIAIPSPDAFLALESDSQSFLARNYERLNSVGEKLIKEGKDEIATYIVNVYGALAKKAVEVQFTQPGSENPIVSQLEGNLGVLIEIAQRYKNLEVVYAGAGVKGDIGILAAQNGFQTTLFGIEQRLVKIAVHALVAKQLVIVDRCVDYLNQITTEVFLSDKIVRHTVLGNPVRGIAEIAQGTLLVVRNKYLPNDFSSQQTLSKSYDGLSSSLHKVFSHYFEITDAREARRYESDLVALLREVNLSLRDLAEKIKECDGFLIHSISRFISHTNQLIIGTIKDDRFEDSEIEKWLTWNIHLPGWFVHYSEKFDGSSLPFHDLVESVAKTGVLGFSALEDKKVVKDSADCILSMGMDSIDKVTKTYGFDEPRIVERAFYLGILAQKKGWMDVAMGIALGIRKFEKKFIEKYRALHPDVDLDNHRIMGVPHSDQLFQEIMSWRDRFDYERLNGVHLMEDSKDMVGSLIEESDIDRFIFFVWGKVLDDSSIRMELEAELKRMSLKKLVRLLKKRAHR